MFLAFKWKIMHTLGMLLATTDGPKYIGYFGPPVIFSPPEGLALYSLLISLLLNFQLVKFLLMLKIYLHQ